jgi:creatinine amidohydrolase
MPVELVLARKVELARMTHLEVPLACAEANGVVVIPIGATEQHGRHLPMFTDTITTEVTVLRGARDAQVVVAPAIPYGNSRQNIGFAGTISVRPGIFGEFVKDICHSLHRHGFDKIVVVNGHGGNAAPLTVALEEFHLETGATTALVKCWQLASFEAPAGAPPWEGHAGRQETELMLALTPEDVDTAEYSVAEPTVQLGEMATLAPPQYNPFDAPITVMISAWESTVTGHYGDPSMATIERGQLILDTWARNLAAFLSRLKAGEVKQSLREGRMPPH